MQIFPRKSCDCLAPRQAPSVLQNVLQAPNCLSSKARLLMFPVSHMNSFWRLRATPFDHVQVIAKLIQHCGLQDEFVRVQ